MSGITANGFERDSLEQIKATVNADFLDVFSTIENGVKITPALETEEFLGGQSVIAARIEDRLTQLLEKIYYSRFLSTATGASLDRAAFPKTRFPAVGAVTNLSFIGIPFTLITTDKLFETENHIQFHLVDPLRLDSHGDGVGQIVCTKGGLIGNVPAESITFIVAPIAGVIRVINYAAATGGTEIETDNDFRARVIKENQTGITSSLDSVISAVRNVSGMIAVKGYENLTNDFDIAGLPPGAVNIVVQGGTDQAIADAIYSRCPEGNPTFGAQSAFVTTLNGERKQIYFDRIEIVPVYVALTLLIDANYVSATETPIIKNQVLKYIGGTDPDGIVYAGCDIGETVRSWKIHATLFEVSIRNLLPGILDASALIGLSTGDRTHLTLAMARNQRPTVAYADISIVASVS